ncbi:DNA starvation/stationary phase protection protein [Verrucomicrobia bacterium LW23]|nr:DNA starvation/stationary phase protection protein [Verrucomicrobia bacterium LW23]
MHQSRSAKVSIGLDSSMSKATVAILNTLLADMHVLYVRTRNFHWNVTGDRFHSLHEFFEKLYEAQAEEIDEVAERIRSLGGRPLGTMDEFIKNARLKEHPESDLSASGMLTQLLADHEEIIRDLRTAIPTVNDKHADLGTADFLTGLMESHEKSAWMIRSHLQ